MSRTPRAVFDPKDPLAMAEHVARIQRVVDGDVEFGSPQDPRNPTSTTLANGTAHNGTIVNVKGSWVEVNVTALDTLVACVHNLGQAVTVVAAVNQPNVRWLVFGLFHDGTAVTSTSSISCNYETTDAASITADSFPLRFYCAATRTIDADHPLRVTLLFVGAVR